MNPKNKRETNKPLSFAKVSIILVFLISVVVIIAIVFTNPYDSNDNDVDNQDDSQNQEDQQGVEAEVEDDHSHEFDDHDHFHHQDPHTPVFHDDNDVLPPVVEDIFEDVDYQDISLDTETKFTDSVSDSLKIDEIVLFRSVLDDYYASNRQLPSNSAIFANLIEQNRTFNASLFAGVLPLVNNQLQDNQIYYSPRDINFSLNIPENSVVVIGQAKCNITNQTVGVRVRKHLVTQVAQDGTWNDRVNHIDAHTTTPGHARNIAMIFRLRLRGADYTYCHHDYPHNYNLVIN